jgi:signal transduction histidine kinase
MVNNILDYAKIKAKKLVLNLQPTNIKELLNNVIEMHAIKAK